MKKGLSFTIQNRLVITAVVITGALVILGVATNIYMKNSFSQFALINKVEGLNTKELQLRKYEKEFLLQETSSSSFFKTEQSPILDSFYSSLSAIESDIFELKTDERIIQMGLYWELSKIESGFKNYRANFEQLKKHIIDKGFKDYGLVGDMRKQIHRVENIVENQENLLFSKMMLMLRRHEKDYLLRRDTKYKDKFDNQISLFNEQLNLKPSEKNKEISKLLLTYQLCFHKIIDKDIIIGLKNNEGLISNITDNIDQIEADIKYAKAIMNNIAEKRITNAVITLFGAIIMLSAFILLIIYYNSRYIVSSIKSLREYILRLGRGQLPDEIDDRGNDEIAEMKRSINILTNNLKKTRDFAIEVGNGNLHKEINVFEGQGELGSNLINMRSKLMQVADEQARAQEQSEKRLWANEGFSIFDEVLRSNVDNFENLNYAIISQLVKYLNANQGAIFIKDDQAGSETVFNLTAAYAFDRRKYLNKQIKLGEGMIGACAYEGETCYMTNIPDDYVDIISGLGGAKPSCVLIVPLKTDLGVFGAIEIASFNFVQEHELKFIEKVCQNIASHFHFVHMSIKTKKLLSQTKDQAEEMAAQEEELRQNLEEMTVIQENQNRQEKKLLDQIESLKQQNKKLSENQVPAHKDNSIYESIKKLDYDDMYA